VTDPLLRNVKLFYAFRIFFHARFYYPVFAVLFLDFGLTTDQFVLLNTVWAVTIVVLEVPSGALADTIGRTTLLRLASALMVVEMLLILLAPPGETTIVFWMFFANRIVSGAAEALASGADEALAYDSLAAAHEKRRWAVVLERCMKYQSAAFMVAMIAGGLLYDADQINSWLAQLNPGSKLPESLVLTLPVIATFLMACGACIATAMMVEPGGHYEQENNSDIEAKNAGDAWKRVLSAGKKILTTPVLFLIILTGLLHDSIIRMLLTLGSEYYRLIQIEEKYFGFIGAGMAMVGIFLPMLARIGANYLPPPVNFSVVALITFISFCGITLAIPIHGLWFVLLMMSGFSLLNYFISYYLNRHAESSQRATILSFRGLAYNMGYGLLGLAYAGYLGYLKEGETLAKPDFAFAESLKVFPVVFLAAMAFLVLVALVLARKCPKGCPDDRDTSPSEAN